MKPTRTLATALTLVALVSGAAVSASAAGRNAQDDPFEKLKSYDYQSRASVAALYAMIQQSLADKAATADIEKHLDAVLDDPKATVAGKQEACRMLWIIGSAQSVPALAKMLTDEKLSDSARYALERNADPAAARALRVALASAKDRMLIGIINSLGDRGDAEAPPVLKPYVASTDPTTAEAAITALGKIGNETAITILRALPANSLPAGHALLRAATNLTATGKRLETLRLYEALAGESRPSIVRAEALRGLVTMQDPHAAAEALAALKSPDPYLQEVAARLAGALEDAPTTARVIAAWPTLPAPTQAILLTALADSHKTAAASIALTAIESKDPLVRTAGIQAAARLGGAKTVPRLMDIALHGEGGDKNTARASLASMPGAEAEQSLLQLARTGPPDERRLVIGIMADRPTPEVRIALFEAARGPEAQVAAEALRTLARIGGLRDYSELIDVLVTTQNDDVRDAAKEAVITVGQRLGDQAADAALVALTHAKGPGKAALLPVLAATGSERALDALTQAAGSSDPLLKQAAITALADNWSDTRPLPTLLDVAKTDADRSLQIQALRGYIRLVGQDEKMPWPDKVDKLGQAINVALRPEEKKQALGVLRECRTVPAMEMAAKLLDTPEVFPEAADTVLYLAAPQRRNNRNLEAVKGDATTAALDKVIQLTKDDKQRETAQKLKG